MVMFDTDFIVAVLRGDKTALKRLLDYESSEEYACMSTVTVFELLRGVQRSRNSEKDRETYAKAVAKMYAADYTYIEADLTAHIDARLARAGTPIGLPDMMIAATCLSIGHFLVTRNTRHFEMVPGLKVETW